MGTKLLKIAFLELGVKQQKEGGKEPRILEYFQKTGFKEITNDKVPWCAAFLNWVLFKAGQQGTESNLARSFLPIGEPIDKPQLGDIVVLWRDHPDSWKGHAGLFLIEDPDEIYILGGNQDQQVSIKAYPKSQLLGYRRLNVPNV